MHPIQALLQNRLPGHEHEYPLNVGVQAPPLTHGFDEQAPITNNFFYKINNISSKKFIKKN